MSQDDRVEALESRVADLEATVNGLTKELVDATGRIRELEEELGLSPEQRTETPTPDATESAPEESSTDDTAKGAGGEGGDEHEDADAGDDIIVA